ncbi:hypothetical protein F383_15347 [Gossypium arboreum]|uniref:Uncharacterized protein n=1 Tax=Gossypium arboreum TaxID=29729 RepID=A0A0B0NEA4_GOSAR|nr:hypothetical protein F383_19148 [Gossypium arboreum]KHG12884.1 hypothetical protein F383_19149 [Gossypium arboreum]KHG28888.1 hypothetical protein F383_15347 [Gossypium arboreum]
MEIRSVNFSLLPCYLRKIRLISSTCSLATSER